jgi:uncharacterized protein
MPENESSERTEILLAYSLGLANPNTNGENLARARGFFEIVTPLEVMDLVDSVMQAKDDIEEVKTIVTRMLHSFTKALTKVSWVPPEDIPYLVACKLKNERIGALLASMKPLVVQINRSSLDAGLRAQITRPLTELLGLIAHYSDKENILFPVIENHIEQSRCVQLMWAIHDDVRATLKKVLEFLQREGSSDVVELNKMFGSLFFDVRSMIFREEQVLFPAVLDRIPRESWLSLSESQYDNAQVSLDSEGTRITSGSVDLVTGSPSAAQLIQIFNNLPVDITLVDADDRVVYFNTPADRIFPRAKSVVGRKVQNCHPPKSVHIVEDIVTAFREKRRNEAEFRLTMGEKYILIRYVALYGSDGDYAGTLEISQDITEIRKLEGDKRLLDWGK